MDKIVFESIDRTEANMVLWALERENIQFIVTGLGEIEAIGPALTIRISVSEDLFAQAYELLYQEGLLKEKKAKRIYPQEEVHWVWYMISYIPTVVGSLFFLKPRISLTLLAIYHLIGFFIYRRYKETKSQ